MMFNSGRIGVAWLRPIKNSSLRERMNEISPKEVSELYGRITL
jgi:hypothetical protein